MTLHRAALLSLLLAAAVPAGATAQQVTESPVGPGFWSWPRVKLSKPEEIAATCRTKVAVQFADGRYFGITFQAAAGADRPKRLPPVVDEVGQCRFDKDAQLERCELSVTDEAGNTSRGTLESRFTKEADGTVKMTVKATTLEGGTSNKSSTFEVFPTRCPDELVWEALNGRPMSR